jgi:hypothetical protein
VSVTSTTATPSGARTACNRREERHRIGDIAPATVGRADQVEVGFRERFARDPRGPRCAQNGKRIRLRRRIQPCTANPCPASARSRFRRCSRSRERDAADPGSAGGGEIAKVLAGRLRDPGAVRIAGREHRRGIRPPPSTASARSLRTPRARAGGAPPGRRGGRAAHSPAAFHRSPGRGGDPAPRQQRQRVRRTGDPAGIGWPARPPRWPNRFRPDT